MCLTAFLCFDVVPRISILYYKQSNMRIKVYCVVYYCNIPNLHVQIINSSSLLIPPTSFTYFLTSPNIIYLCFMGLSKMYKLTFFVCQWICVVFCYKLFFMMEHWRSLDSVAMAIWVLCVIILQRIFLFMCMSKIRIYELYRKTYIFIKF